MDKDATKTAWQSLSPDEAAEALRVNPADGLSGSEAQQRLADVGPNALSEKAKEPKWRIFLRQYADYMQIMLLVAAVLSVVIGDWSTGLLLFVLTLVNASLSYRQEAKAEASVAALSEMLQVQARVLRDGKRIELPAEQLVPGDVVMFEAGDQIPADGRLIRLAALEIEESALTGESQPVAKELQAIPGDVPLGDRKNLAFMNSLVTRGTGTMLVTTTGMDTEIGRIATLLDEVEADKSPLQKQIDALTQTLGYIAVTAMVIVIGFGLLRGQPIDQLFVLATALAVAAVPTGMPTVVTALLSLGTQRLAEEHAIVKNLSSVETLGSTAAICSDKTGTLTLNKMTAVALIYGANRYNISGVGYSDVGQIKHVAGQGDAPLEPVLLPMALCSDAVVTNEELVGDPTEGALVVLAAKGGIDVAGTRTAVARIAEVPFDSAYKFMATFHHFENAAGEPVVRCFVKGAPDVITSLAEDIHVQPGTYVPMADYAARVQELNEQMAAEGLRVLALAQRDFPADSFDPDGDLFSLVTNLTLLGLVGIIDPPRPEARDAIAVAQSAGIRVRMITGDHKVTAGAIGKELGIYGDAISGSDLQAMSEEELAGRIDDIGVIGRVAPEHKVRIVQALQAKDAITAMTGDGVNDAPALKAADIGIAMGITGTEVSKQAATMILTDDNFATIVRAIELGRAIYDNLLKYLRFQLITLMGYIVLFVGASVFNIANGAPLNPMQILWINFLVDVPLALGLGSDKASSDLMQRKPRKSDEPIMDRSRAVQWFILGTVMAIATLAGPVLALNRVTGDAIPADTLVTAGTMVLTTLGFAHIFTMLSSRSETQSAFTAENLDPTFLSRAGLSLLAIIVVTELGFLQEWFTTTSLTWEQWLTSMVAASAVLWAMEIQKFFLRRQAK